MREAAGRRRAAGDRGERGGGERGSEGGDEDEGERGGERGPDVGMKERSFCCLTGVNVSSQVHIRSFPARGSTPDPLSAPHHSDRPHSDLSRENELSPACVCLASQLYFLTFCGTNRVVVEVILREVVRAGE
ncbi:hypothetical protein GN956_G25822 [Arapaima gigas]